MKKALSLWLENFVGNLSVRMPANAWLTGKYAVIGAGGVGTWITLLIALHADPRATEIHIVDNDKLELHNANRLPYPIPMFLQKVQKATALRKYIEWIRPGITVKDYLTRIDDDNGKSLIEAINPKVVIDAVDNTRSLELLKKIAADLRKPILSLHYDGWHGTVEWIPRPWEEEGGAWTLNNAAHYTTPSTALTPAALAVIGVLILLKKPEEPIIYTFNLK